MKKYLSIALLLLSIASCTSQKKVTATLNSWLGSSKSDLILSWGPPNNIVPDGASGEVLIYSRRIYVPAYRVDYYDYKMMYANKGGRIYHWLTRRDPNLPERIDVNLFIH